MMNQLAFNAISTSAQRDEEVADCSFVGALGREFALMSEDGALVRIAWRDGSAGEDEGIVGIARVVLVPGRVSITFDRTADGWHSTIPYEGVDITYDDVDDRHHDLVDVFSALLSSAPDCVHSE